MVSVDAVSAFRGQSAEEASHTEADTAFRTHLLAGGGFGDLGNLLSQRFGSLQTLTDLVP